MCEDELLEKLHEAEMRLRLIADMQTTENGQYIPTAGRVMKSIAEEYFRMWDAPMPPHPLKPGQMRDWRLLHAHKR